MYLQHFGFSESPFNVTADPSFLFSSRVHEEAMAHLWYGIEQRKGFIALTGDVGTGKTTLCRAVLRALDPSAVHTAFILNSKLSADELLRAIIEDLGLQLPTPSTRFAAIQTLNRFLLTQLAEDKNTVVFIDEAQNLGPEELEVIRLLSNLETDKDKLLQVILVGQPELRAILNREDLRQLRQRITVQYHMRPMLREEIPRYIQHRLRVAGYDGAALFQAASYEALYRYSQGVPRLINVLCDKLLLACFAYQLPTIGPEIVRQGIVELEGEAP